jgi:hypothetical protein
MVVMPETKMIRLRPIRLHGGNHEVDREARTESTVPSPAAPVTHDTNEASIRQAPDGQRILVVLAAQDMSHAGNRSLGNVKRRCLCYGDKNTLFQSDTNRK